MKADRLLPTVQLQEAVPSLLTVYPDAHPEITTVDGMVGHDEPYPDLDWGVLVAAPGNEAEDDNVDFIYVVYISSSFDSGKWDILKRAIFLFDVSALAGGTITEATFTVRGNLKNDSLNIAPDVNLYGSNPASDTALIGTDFATLESTPYCDTPITYALWRDTAYNDFILNAAGLVALQAAIDGDGIFRVGLRNANYDVSGTPPAWRYNRNSYLGCIPAELHPATRPKLVITYMP